MNVLFHMNCQADGVIHFLKHSEDGHKVNTRTNLVYLIELNMLDSGKVRDNIDWADVIFYHEVKRLEKPTKSGVETIPMSVYHNAGYYVSNASDEHWEIVKEYAKRHCFNSAVKFAVESTEMGHACRYEKSISRMIEKEILENVPEDMRLSSVIVCKDKIEQQSLTYNHPSSYVLFDLTNLVLKKLGLREIKQELRSEVCRDLNAAGLPCVDWICSGARDSLGLSYGGTKADNAECEKIVAKKLREVMK